jgi:hypothetical protein
MLPSLARTNLFLKHLRPLSPFKSSPVTHNLATNVRKMSHSLYGDDTPAEVKNAKVCQPACRAPPYPY